MGATENLSEEVSLGIAPQRMRSNPIHKIGFMWRLMKLHRH